MNNAFLAILFTSFSLALATAVGQEINLPTPPFVGKIPPSHTVTITVRSSDPPKELTGDALEIRRKYHPILHKIELFKDAAGLLEIVRTFESGSTRSFFVDGAYLEEPLPLFPGRYRAINREAHGVAMPEYDKTDFPSLTWIQAKHFVEKSREAGRELWHFRELAEADSGGNPTVLREVWVDSRTRLPFRWRDQEHLYQFEKLVPWDGTVNLPTNAQALIGR